MTSITDLPDLDEVYPLIDEIYNLNLKVSKLELTIKLREAEITRTAQIDNTYFIGGKPPSQTYIDNAFKFSGFNNELIPLREELLEAEAELIRKKSQLDIIKIQIDLWRTQSANERVAVL